MTLLTKEYISKLHCNFCLVKLFIYLFDFENIYEEITSGILKNFIEPLLCDLINTLNELYYLISVFFSTFQIKCEQQRY